MCSSMSMLIVGLAGSEIKWLSLLGKIKDLMVFFILLQTSVRAVAYV